MASLMAHTTPLEELSKRISAILREEGAIDVWSYTAPLGKQGFGRSGEETMSGSPADADYWNPKQGCLRFEVIASDQPFAQETLKALQRSLSRIDRMFSNEISPGKQSTVLATGPIAYMVNVKSVAERDHRFVQIVVVVAIGVILIILLKNTLVAITLVSSSLLVYFATMGLAGFLFNVILQQGELDWKINLFSFVVLMAVGQDYNLFFLGRLLEERQTQPLLPAIAKTIARSGSIISSCGLITAVAVGSLCFSGVGFLQQMGFVLTVGLLLDAFLIRPFLLPAVLAVLRHPRKG
jgi:RND superfamily putative drug exporter